MKWLKRLALATIPSGVDKEARLQRALNSWAVVTIAFAIVGMGIAVIDPSSRWILTWTIPVFSVIGFLIFLWM